MTETDRNRIILLLALAPIGARSVTKNKGGIDMRKKFRILLSPVLIISVLASSGTFAAIKENTTSQNIAASARNKAQTILANGADSIQYEIKKGQSDYLSGAYGQASPGDRGVANKFTLYGIGEISELYTSAAVLKLSDQYQLDLDQPVTKYIPEFTMKDSRYKSITVRMLLNHSSGLAGVSTTDVCLYGENKKFDEKTFLSSLSESSLLFTPGSMCSSSSDNTVLCQMIIERVTNTTYSEYIQQNFLTKLGQTNTMLSDTIDDKNVAAVYQDGKILPQENMSYFSVNGFYSTASDLCKLPRIYESTEYINKESADAALSAQYKNGVWPSDTSSSFTAYGIGWDCVDTYPFSNYSIRAYVKNGSTSGYQSTLIYLPDYQITAAALTSGGSYLYNQAMLTDLILQILIEDGVIEEMPIPVTYHLDKNSPIPDSQYANEGLYASADKLIRVSFFEGDKMAISSPFTGTISALYNHSSNGIFINDKNNTKITFEKEANGQTYIHVQSYLRPLNLGQLYLNEYAYQKLPSNQLMPQTSTVWSQRENNIYFQLNERYSSQTYTEAMPALHFDKTSNGYVGSAKIVDENNAVPAISIPGDAGNGVDSYHFLTQQEIEYYLDFTSKPVQKEYLQSNGKLYVSSANLHSLLDPKFSNTITIGEKGFAQWFLIDSLTGDKNLSVTKSKEQKGSFTVYNTEGSVIFSSLLSANKNINLPTEGYIVFAGDAGTTFQLSLSH